jgi:hypothetical protein
VWIECRKRNYEYNATKLKRVQRLINVKIAQAFLTTSYEALIVLTGITPILIELGNLARYYHITRENEQEGYDAPKDYRKWSHPAEAIEVKEKCERKEYKIEFYKDGSKSANRVASGIPIFFERHLTYQLKYKLTERCSSNQAEKFAIAKTLEKMKDLYHEPY